MGPRSPRKRSERPKVLLSEGSSTSARQTVYGLGKICTLEIVDPSPLCQCRFSRFVRRWHRCPSYSRQPREYVEFLVQRLQQQRYDVLFPTHEQVYLLARYRDALATLTGVALPEFDSVRRMQSKADFARLLDELGLPAPETVFIRSRRECQRQWEYPCYVKAAHGTAGREVRRVHSAEEFREAIDAFERMGYFQGQSELLVQQPAKGVQAVAQAVFQHGRLLAAHCAEALWTGIGGGPMLRVAASHPIVVQHLRRLGEYLGWHGPMFLEYFYDSADGQPQYIEANPRIGETVNAKLCGVNLCDLVIRIALGEKLQPVESSEVGVRSHLGFVSLLAKAQLGAGRRELLAELGKHWFRTDEYRGSENEITRPREDWLSVVPAAAVLLQLLARPSRAHRIIEETVENYGLPQTAVERIDALPENLLAGFTDS